MRNFRFGVNLVPSGGRSQWSESCRTAERLGYDVIAVPDHLGVQSPSSPWSPRRPSPSGYG